MGNQEQGKEDNRESVELYRVKDDSRVVDLDEAYDRVEWRRVSRRTGPLEGKTIHNDGDKISHLA